VLRAATRLRAQALILVVLHVLLDHILNSTAPQFVFRVLLDIFVCLVAAAGLAMAFVLPAATLLLELVSLLPALFVPRDLTTKLLHLDRPIHACLALRVRTAFQDARLPVALENAPLGVSRHQEVEQGHHAPRVPQVHTVWKAASCREAMAFA
jgi:hypothetical protein